MLTIISKSNFLKIIKHNRPKKALKEIDVAIKIGYGILDKNYSESKIEGLKEEIQN